MSATPHPSPNPDPSPSLSPTAIARARVPVLAPFRLRQAHACTASRFSLVVEVLCLRNSYPNPRIAIVSDEYAACMVRGELIWWKPKTTDAPPFGYNHGPPFTVSCPQANADQLYWASFLERITEGSLVFSRILSRKKKSETYSILEKLRCLPHTPSYVLRIVSCAFTSLFMTAHGRTEILTSEDIFMDRNGRPQDLASRVNKHADYKFEMLRSRMDTRMDLLKVEFESLRDLIHSALLKDTPSPSIPAVEPSSWSVA